MPKRANAQDQTGKCIYNDKDKKHKDKKIDISAGAADAPSSSFSKKEILFKPRENISIPQSFHEKLLSEHPADFVEECYDTVSEWKKDKSEKEIAKATDRGRISKWGIVAVREKRIKDQELKLREDRLKNTGNKKSFRQELEAMGFTHYSVHEGAKCYIDDDRITLERGMTHYELKFKELNIPLDR